METVSKLLKESLPNYLRDLPVPSSFSGLFQLGTADLLTLTPLLTLLSIPSYMTYRWLSNSSKSSKPIKPSAKVNLNVKKECPKVVDTCDIEDLSAPGDKKVYCRCWRSKKFPFCDGSHVSHNNLTGDNVGPLIVARQQ